MIATPSAERTTGADVEQVFVSIVIPCRNEAKFIVACLDSILATTWPVERLEVLVIDGMSDDGTRDIITKYSATRPVVRMLDNPARITPVALNIGIRAARGGVVLRMDAHNYYPPSYAPDLVQALFSSGADNVGGLWLTKPGNSSPTAQAIAVALTHPFGVGNAHYRIGAAQPRWVDTVPFGCYRREVFDKIGLFDEELVRNQDDEFNLRLIQSGGRILLLPSVTSEYHARESLSKLWRMYYQYGLFKPLVIRKVRGVLTVRQLVPAAFVLALTAGIVGSVFSPVFAILLAMLVTLYLAADVAVAFRAGRDFGLLVRLKMCIVFPVIHFAYGFGFLRGFVAHMAMARFSGSKVSAVAITR